MGKTYLMGVDLGTVGTKAAIFDAGGNLVADAYEESKLIYPRPGWVEQEPQDIYGSAVRTIRECLEKSGITPGDVAALAFDGQMAGLSTVDGDWGTPTVYDSWLDTRCEPYIKRMQEHEGLIIQKAGGTPSYNHGPKILWWQHERPEVFAKICKFLQPASYVAGRMAGLKGDEAFIDYTYLHFSCLADTEQAAWSPEICDLFGVPMEKLPRIVEPWHIIGRVTAAAAGECGLVAGTPIAAGCGDQAANMMGAAMVEPGLVFDVAGTASVLAFCGDRFAPDPVHRTLLMGRLVQSGGYYALAYINGGGLNLRWFRDEWAREEMAQARREGGSAYAILDEAAAKVPPGAECLFFFPHLAGRVCPNDPALRGLWLGFSWAHHKEHFYRSLLEGVAYEYAYYLSVGRELFPALQVNEARVIGGGSRSALWNQIKADVLGVPYVRLNRQECGVLGSAIVAGYSVGVFDDLKGTAQRFVRTTDRTEPRPEYHEFYKDRVKIYSSLFDTLRQTYLDLSRLPATP